MEERLNELEIKLSFADDAIDELNRTVFRQQQLIEQLQHDLRALRQQMLASLPEEKRTLQDEIPPHY
ncbi:SlyX family protein [Azospira sp. APE16]|jgi:SlyX protein|uniref:SlyX protein n=2 Tax=Azospira oryzae TaxID=146939 RepID=G8QPZ5_AZOOP|nr:MULTISPECIES: SlyX family protein [Azospira]MBP7489888.1 SlyX family protein [Azospira sp.]TLS16888.1 MAG: SlyX family protein [Betaproteobacteria bacterium]AEV27102.1 hypothetical protein Dsui_2755 [Azospira oryzae PS]RZT90000.1 SlyX protein [Azospira oryzae]BBN87535.1 hypothetical protein AZSP09_05580 [Azospira sp. I09]